MAGVKKQDLEVVRISKAVVPPKQPLILPTVQPTLQPMPTSPQP